MGLERTIFPLFPGPQVLAFQLGALHESPECFGPVTHKGLRANMSGIAVPAAAAAIVKAVMIAKRMVFDLDWKNCVVKAG